MGGGGGSAFALFVRPSILSFKRSVVHHILIGLPCVQICQKVSLFEQVL